jgi:hypothetical protein
MSEILRHIIVSTLKRLRGHIRPCHGNLDREYVFFSGNPIFMKENQEMDEDEEKRVIEDLPVVSSVRFHTGDKTHKSGVYANLRCGCGAKQVGPVRKSSKRPTFGVCLRELGRLIQQDHDPTWSLYCKSWKLLKKMLLMRPQNVLMMRELSRSTQIRCSC